MKPGLNIKSIIRNVIIAVIVVAIGYFGYSYFFKKGATTTDTGSGLTTTAGINTPTDTSSSTDTGASTGADLSGDFLATLLSVQSINLDDRIFTNPAFTSLQDFSRPLLPDTNPGRPNPFAPLGSDAQGVSTQISTSNPSLITANTSILNGTLTVEDSSAMRWFAYGTTLALGSTTVQKAQTTPGAFAETIIGLTPNTTYYVKAMASIGGQTVAGNLITWVTAQAKR